MITVIKSVISGVLNGTVSSMEWTVGAECWSGVLELNIPNFGMEKWATLPSIQTKPCHSLENTKNINFHSAGVGVNSYQT